MDTLLEQAIQTMHSAGHRSTPQRLVILQVIADHNGHITTDEVYRAVKAKYPHLNRATVYRTLDFLCELRLINTCDSGDRRMIYELAGSESHHHLVCRTCGRIETVSGSEIQPFFDQIEAQHDYLIDMDHLALYGLCPACRKIPSQRKKGV